MSLWRFISSSSTSFSRSSSRYLTPCATSRHSFSTIFFRAGSEALPIAVAYFARRSSWCRSSLSTCFSSWSMRLLCADSILDMLYQERRCIFRMPRVSPRRKRVMASLAAMCFLRPSLCRLVRRFQSTKTEDFMPASSPPKVLFSIISIVECAWPFRSLIRPSFPSIAFSCSDMSCFCRSSQCRFSISTLSPSDLFTLRTVIKLCQLEKQTWMLALLSPSIERRSALLTALCLSALPLIFFTYSNHSRKTAFFPPLDSPICHFMMVDSTALKASALRRSASVCALLSCTW
mmetsp:Transcript_60016/g.157841  ORF Transcript_60016/g.157841 Transcript_60016/m.157841 type:complete len:290 (-) Transcript_60016:2613-3482(-)